jgi:hypothetical protein
MKTLKKLASIATIAIASVPAMALAAPANTLNNTPRFGSIDEVIAFATTIQNYIFTILLVASIFLGLWAAWIYLTAGGEPKNVEKAKNMLLYAFIGLAVAILSTSIAPITKSILGV